MTAAPSAMCGELSGKKTMRKAPREATTMRKFSSSALPRARLRAALTKTG